MIVLSQGERRGPTGELVSLEIKSIGRLHFKEALRYPAGGVIDLLRNGGINPKCRVRDSHLTRIRTVPSGSARRDGWRRQGNATVTGAAR